MCYICLTNMVLSNGLLTIPAVLISLISVMTTQTADSPVEDIRQVIYRVTPNFEDNLKRAFRNQGIRVERKKPINFAHRLDDVFLNLDDTKIEMGNLNFQWIPDFRINNLSANLNQQCLVVSLYLGNLRVEGDYEANNLTMQKILPVSHVGKIGMTFQNVKAHGRIGLKVKEDSLLPMNYDINYQSTDVLIRVNYHVDSQNEIENEISNSIIDSTLCRDVWAQLNAFLTTLLHRQLSESLVEFSLSELLLDHEEEFRALVAEQAHKANRLLDSILYTSKNYLVATDVRQVTTPPFDIVFKGKPSGVHQGNLATGDGYIRDLATLTRTDNFHIFEEENILTLYGNLQIRDFKDIDVDASNLGALSWLAVKLEAWVKGNLRFKALPVLENQLQNAFQHATIRARLIL